MITQQGKITCFEEAVMPLTPELKSRLLALDDGTKGACTEIRLRAMGPLSLFCGSRHCYLALEGGVTEDFGEAYECTAEIINDTYSRMCGYSVHTHHSDIIKGFITLNGGHRAGICGTAAVDSNGNIISVRDISSLNIRISREITGCAEKIYNEAFYGESKSIILVGPPACGKTTVLRDIVRLLSDSGKKVSLIDERNEIACTVNGKRLKYVGANTDVYCSYPKELALNMALRTMSPDYIAVDEVCDEGEIRAIRAASNCGVSFVVTVHALNFSEIASREQIISLINTEAFDRVVLLGKQAEKGSYEIFETGDIKDEIYRRRNNMDVYCL